MPCGLVDPTVIYEFPQPGTLYAEYGDSICAVTEDMDLQLLYSASWWKIRSGGWRSRSVSRKKNMTEEDIFCCPMWHMP